MTRSPMIRLLTRRASRVLLGLMALIVMIFITEIFTSELEAVISSGGHALDLLRLLLLRTPEVIDFALPIVLFLGLYFAIDGARTDRELIICAAAGERWQKIPRVALTFGLLAMLLSLLFSGLITPASNHLLRLTYYDLQSQRILQAITDPGDRIHIQEIEGRTIIASPPDSPDSERGSLFIYSGTADGGWRVARADDWAVVGPDDDGAYQVALKRFREYRGDAAEAPPPTDMPDDTPGKATLDFAQVNVQTVEVALQIGDIVEAVDRSRHFNERFLLQAGGPVDGEPVENADGAIAPAPTPTFGEIVAAALLCPVAALLAVAGAALAGTRRGRFLGLPLGLILVLGGDVGGRAVLGEAAALGYPAFWAGAMALLALGLAPALIYVRHRAERIVIPLRGRE
ncbi:LptF/LptG family permease [Pseudoruegeria sp. HB172150]|uniref:LptF/LptG family permease n=1 Tax=Pseudoruegeria sp. HB172150 TaxID=2721164 RepID=UPI001556E4FF|nr:LptF/LptG family permease [Pseudoruegeria sp. HB172150]